MSKFSRREFLKLGGAGAVTAGTATMAGGCLAPPEDALAVQPGGTTLDYPITTVANANKLAINKPVSFTYPDKASPCMLVRIGHAVPGGVGPGKDIVAYSTLCTHMGCPVSYDADSRNFKCPCHFSVFDSEKTGQMVTGQATENLPRILLSHDAATGDIKAVGVDGLIYGRQANTI
ncbi:arsenate reductase (azurin) small subunit [Thiohalophilus sp.]|uniref:arsenate reductase (azurin) small subunit n=1 Tax=Thiohalophilus sp. TaxID=3028392 RepID=UPI002ACE080E|nr:arsenate reductase (azurin) small subunit [Thiohalophilus sp.]MDZ7802715.1 arsenate reductase (azurin) small subunit [Thiohalophilus sp.]